MFDVKKEQERDKSHRAIWSITDDLRGDSCLNDMVCFSALR